MTDNEIQCAIEDYFESEFGNFGGDLLDELLDGEDETYDRATVLLDRAKIRIEWSQ